MPCIQAIHLSSFVADCCTYCRALSIDSSCLQAKQFLILHLLCKEGNYTEVNDDTGLGHFTFWLSLLLRPELDLTVRLDQSLISRPVFGLSPKLRLTSFAFLLAKLNL